MFKMTLSDVGLLTGSIPIIAEIIDEGVFKFEKNGISLVSPDRTMVAVVDLKILSTAFDEYEVEEDESIGLNLANLVAVLKRVKTGDKLMIESSKGNKLKITVEGNGTRTFRIPVIDVNSEKPPLDQLKFNGSVELSSNIVEEGIADAQIIGDAVFFEADDSGFKMYSKGDVSSAELELRKGHEDLLDIKAPGSMKAQYPLEYLRKMVKAARLSKQVMLEFGQDYPMRLSFKAIDKMSLNFILAPRVSEE